MIAGLGDILRLGIAAMAERQRLVGADHHATGHGEADGLRLLLGQQPGDLCRSMAGCGPGFIQRALVNGGGNQFDIQPGTGQHAARAGDFDARTSFMRCPCRTSCGGGLEMRDDGRAVSSMDRRVTSMIGQRFSVNSRREAVISSATALRST